MPRKRKTQDAVEILNRRVRKNKRLEKLLKAARINAQVAQLIYAARRKAGLSQKRLAELVGTTQSVIARLEDSDYEGHTLTVLQRIAGALNKGIRIDFIDSATA